MSNTLKRRLIKTTALTIDILPPFIATLVQFPVWVEKGSDATLSGVFLVLAFLSCIPFMRQLKEFIKSPSAPILWFAVFVLLTALDNIIDQMIVVSFIGVISNTIGAFIYKLGGAYNREEE